MKPAEDEICKATAKLFNVRGLQVILVKYTMQKCLWDATGNSHFTDEQTGSETLRYLLKVTQFLRSLTKELPLTSLFPQIYSLPIFIPLASSILIFDLKSCYLAPSPP